MTSPTDSGQTALETLGFLESRLRRLEFYITGQDAVTDAGAVAEAGAEERRPAHVRLFDLERSLEALSAQNPLIAELLELQRLHPELFQPSSGSASHTTRELREILLAHAPLFPQTSSQLISLQDSPIPPTESFVSLADLSPRIARAELVQEEQARQVEELRLRTTALLQRWYETGVLGMGECWVEWEARLLEAEKVTRRREGRRQEESTLV